MSTRAWKPLLLKTCIVGNINGRLSRLCILPLHLSQSWNGWINTLKRYQKLPMCAFSGVAFIFYYVTTPPEVAPESLQVLLYFGLVPDCSCHRTWSGSVIPLNTFFIVHSIGGDLHRTLKCLPFCELLLLFSENICLTDIISVCTSQKGFLI